MTFKNLGGADRALRILGSDHRPQRLHAREIADVPGQIPIGVDLDGTHLPELEVVDQARDRIREQDVVAGAIERRASPDRLKLLTQRAQWTDRPGASPVA